MPSRVARWPVLLGSLFAVVALCACTHPVDEETSAPGPEALDGARAALTAREWDQAIELAELAVDAEADVDGAREIIAAARREKDHLSLIDHAASLFAAGQYDKAYVKLQAIAADSAYAVRASNLALRIRQAAVLPESMRRKGNGLMRRVLIGTYPRGSSDAEIDRVLKLCEKEVGDCERKWFTRESPRRFITLGSFYIDTTEVSAGSYAGCVAAGGCRAIDWQGCGVVRESIGDWAASNLPQVCVTWDEARTYCEWADGRLPTEAEWERAARGPNDARYPWGAKWRPDAANWGDDGREDGFGGLAPVDAFQPQGFGLYNMSGNAYEWVADWYDEAAYGGSDRVDPRGPRGGTQRVIRGGAYNRASPELRAAHRNRMPDEFRDKTVGFRCAASPVVSLMTLSAAPSVAPTPPVVPAP